VIDFLARLDRFKRRLLLHLDGVWVVCLTVLFAALHLWPPHR
jgi:hypothetical protein